MIEMIPYSALTLSALGGLFATMLLIADRFLANYGPCRIDVNGERSVTVEGGCTVLDALYSNEVFIPSGCGGQGTCGHCKVTLLSGGGPVLPTELPLLSEQEIAAGVRLACQVKVKQDVELRVREEYFSIQRFTAEVAAARMLTHDTREVRLRLVEPPIIDFRPGQYVQVEVPVKGESVHRAYSISSAPEQAGEIGLIVRLVPGGAGSTYLHRVRAGDRVSFTGPYGEFVLSEHPETEVVCVAGGCGIAPIKCILEYVCRRWPARPCRLFFGVRAARDLLCMDEFRRLAREHPAFAVHCALSAPEPGDEWDGETGLIHLSVERHLAPGPPRQAFLCGPEPMVRATEEVLRARDVPDAMIYYDNW